MEFNILSTIVEQCKQRGLSIIGVAHNPFRIDFSPETTEKQKKEAHTIATDCMAREEELRVEYETEEAKKITPEKVQPLVDLLVSKGILTQEEINQL